MSFEDYSPFYQPFLRPLAVFAVTWYTAIWAVGLLGHIRVRRTITPPLEPGSLRADAFSIKLEPPIGVSILRPIKSPGQFHTEPHLIECLLSTVRQKYPLFELVLTVASTDDPAIPGIRQMIRTNADVDIILIIGEEKIGINPKINNLVRGWRQLKYDIVWIVDCNVWLDPGALGRAVDVLTGQPHLPQNQSNKPTLRKPAKFVHHLPICVNSTGTDKSLKPWMTSGDGFGAALEETFLSSSHCKFYCGINTVAIAPCIIGKSNMFRKSHLMELCPPDADSEGGLASFSTKLCEDHLIAEKLWMYPLEEEEKYHGANSMKKRYIKHALLNEPAFQPMSGMTLREYWSRRSRWLKVRKFAVLAATIVEPGTECFLGSLIGALGFRYLELLPADWDILRFWSCSVALWGLGDWFLYQDIHKYSTVDITDPHCPVWLKDGRRTSFLGWLFQWLGRETLALPIWFNGMFRGDVNWRGTGFKVSMAGVKGKE